MNVKIQKRNMHLSPNLQRLIGRQCAKVRRILPTFAPQDLHLHVTIEKKPRSQYETALVLTVPQTSIRTEEIEVNPSTSILRAFHELVRRIKRFKSHLGHEHTRHHGPLQTVENLSTDRLLDLETAINNNLEKLQNYIRRELYSQVVQRNLSPGLIEVAAIVDEVFLEVSARAAEQPHDLSLEQWMFQLAHQKLRERLNDLQAHQEDSSIEEPSAVDSRWDDEILNFFQPDESLRLEDLLVDKSSTNPEELIEGEEAEQLIHQLVAQLSDSIRESFVLFAIEGFGADEVAMITGKPSSQILQDVENARRALRTGLSLQ